MKRGPAIFITFVVCALFAVFFIYPAGMVVKQAFEGPDGFTFDFVAAVFQNPIYREGLWNSFAIGACATLAALAIAFPLALVGHRYDFFAKPALGVLVLAPMILPPFVGAVGVKQMLGVNGAFNAALVKAGLMDPALPFDWLAEGRFAGIVLMIAFNLYPILYMNIAAALSNLDPAMEQAAENLGCPPWKRFFRITLPLAMPGVFAGSSIVFIWAFTELGVPLVFDFGRTASVQIFDGLKGLDKNPVPYALTAILLIIAAAVFSLSKFVMGRSPLGTAPRPKGRSTSQRLNGFKSLACAGLFLGVFTLATIPHFGVLMLSLAGRWYGTVIPDEFTMNHYIEALGSGLVVPSIQNSLMYAGCATLLALAIGLGVAWVVVRSDLRIRGFLDAVVMLPLAVLPAFFLFLVGDAFASSAVLLGIMLAVLAQVTVTVLTSVSAIALAAVFLATMLLTRVSALIVIPCAAVIGVVITYVS
jgi:iron(III) transport system permease protein